MVIIKPALYIGLYAFIITLVKSEPPVDERALKINAVPIPVKTPPYKDAKILSFVNGSILFKTSIKKDKLIVPIIDFTKKLFPILNVAKLNRGTFKIKIVVPIGKLNK